MELVFRALLQAIHSPAACSLSVGAGEKSTRVLSLLNPALFQFSCIIALVVGDAQFVAAKQAFPARLENGTEECKAGPQLRRQKGLPSSSSTFLRPRFSEQHSYTPQRDILKRETKEYAGVLSPTQDHCC